jgi:Tfp pilus assembly protein PilN
MRAVTLNLATRPFRNNVIAGSILSAAALAVLLATGYNLYVWASYSSSYSQIVRDEGSDASRLVALESEEKTLAKEIQARDFKKIHDRGRRANELILRRSFSWTQLFNKLEEVVPEEVRATSIRPNIGNEGIQVHLVGEAKHAGAWLALQDRLQHDASFSNVSPQNERKLNPGRPEITFALRFDYLPGRPAQAPSPGAVAAARPGGGPEAGAAAPATGAAATPPAPPRAAARPPIGTVGLDGQPRSATLLARVLAAPGGIYPAPAATAAETRDARGTKGRSAPAAGRGLVPVPAPAAPGRPPAAGSGAPPAAGAPGPATGAPGPAAGGPGLAAAATADRTAAPATRLDLPLRFVGRPVGEIYEALSRAHGVRFLIDPGVDPRVRVTADLSGRKLGDALAAVAQAAGHRVTRQGDGLYRVAATAGGEPIADRPVREEDLKVPGVKP